MVYKLLEIGIREKQRIFGFNIVSDMRNEYFSYDNLPLTLPKNYKIEVIAKRRYKK